MRSVGQSGLSFRFRVSGRRIEMEFSRIAVRLGLLLKKVHTSFIVAISFFIIDSWLAFPRAKDRQ